MLNKYNRIYDILNHRRWLMLWMIWRLHQQPVMPAVSLINTSTGATV